MAGWVLRPRATVYKSAVSGAKLTSNAQNLNHGRPSNVRLRSLGWASCVSFPSVALGSSEFVTGRLYRADFTYTVLFSSSMPYPLSEARLYLSSRVSEHTGT